MTRIRGTPKGVYGSARSMENRKGMAEGSNPARRLCLHRRI
jgi:hypothetical protein